MIYLISHLWLWLLLALVTGLVVGWVTCAEHASRWWTGWTPWGTIAFAIGLCVAVLRLLPDRAGYLLDAGLLLFAAYIIGCFLSGLFRQTRTPGLAVAAAMAAPAPAAVTAPIRAAAPATVPVVAATPAPAPMDKAEAFAGSKPAILSAPRGGKADDLKRIRGIGKQNEGRLHALGVWHFDQIAAWSETEVEWVGGYLAFPGRIEREDWQAQAKVLASGAETEFSTRVAKGEVETSKDSGGQGQDNVADLSKIDKTKH